MNEEAKLNHKPCPNCGNTVDTDSRFCKFCAFDLTKSGSPQATVSEMSSQGVAQGNPNARMIILICVLLGIVGVAVLLLSLRGNSDSRSNSTMSGNSYTTNTSSSTVTSNGTESDSGKLTNAKVENAVRKMVSNLLIGGSITVEGIQEQPQQNAATADLRFNGFQYKTDQAGTPVTKDRQAPKKPEINDPNFYDKMYKYGTQQIQTRSFSGRGVGILKRYNDGRWVLKEVRWEFNGWGGTVDVQ